MGVYTIRKVEKNIINKIKIILGQKLKNRAIHRTKIICGQFS